MRRRHGLVLLASTALGWALHACWPLVAPADDPFRSTFAVIPAVAAALAWLATGTRARSASWTERALLALLVLSLPFRHGLGWSVDDGPWAVALALALTLAVRRRLLDLRPLLRTSRPPAHFFWLPLVVYLAVQPWALETRQPNGDEPYNLLIAHSLAFDLDTDLSNQYADGDSLRFMDRRLQPQTGDPVARDGSQQSRHSALLPALLALPYAVAGRMGAAAVMAILSAALAWSFLGLAWRVPDGQGRAGEPTRRGAFLAWASVAFLPPLVVYAHQIWVEVPAALLLTVALDRLLRLRAAGAVGTPDESFRRDLWVLAVSLALLPLLKLRFALPAASVLVLALLDLRRSRPRGSRTDARRLALRLAGPAAAALAALAVLWLWRYGNPLKLYTGGELATLASPPRHYARGLFGLFYDCSFGLFAAAPLWALMLPGAWWLSRRRAGLTRSLTAVALPYLLVVAPRLEWYGGWAPPFRYALVLAPVIGLVLGQALAERHRPGVRFLLVLLGIPTLLLTLLWLAAPNWTYNLADGYSYLLQQAGALLGADVGRLFPSTVRYRTATWMWVAGSLLLVPIAGAVGRLARGPGRARARRAAGPAGLVAFLLAAAALPLAAHHIPTGHVQVEDRWVAKDGGQRHPGPWRQRRPEAAGGWLIAPGTSIEVPAVAGGSHLEVEIRLLRFGGGIRQLYADIRSPDGTRREVGHWRIDDTGTWHNLVAGPLPWTPGSRLVLYNPSKPQQTKHGLVVDWLEFRWQDP